MQFQGKLINQTLNNGKNLVSSPILAHLAKFEPPIPPPPPKKKNLAPSGIRYHGQVSSCSISEKTNNLILRKLSDRRRRPDWQTNRQTGKSDFIGCCPTNVERPTTASHMIPINKKKYLFKGDVSPNKWFILNSTVYQFSYA